MYANLCDELGKHVLEALFHTFSDKVDLVSFLVLHATEMSTHTHTILYCELISTMYTEVELYMESF